MFILEQICKEHRGDLHVLRRQVELQLLLEVLDEVGLRRELPEQLVGYQLALLGDGRSDELFLLFLHHSFRCYVVISI